MYSLLSLSFYDRYGCYRFSLYLQDGEADTKGFKEGEAATSGLREPVGIRVLRCMLQAFRFRV